MTGEGCPNPEHATAGGTCAACARAVQAELTAVNDRYMRLLTERRQWQSDVQAAARAAVQGWMRTFSAFYLRGVMEEVSAPVREIAGRASMLTPEMALARHRPQLEAFLRAAALNLRQWDQAYGAAEDDAVRMWETWRAENQRLRDLVMTAARALHAQSGRPPGGCRCDGCEMIRAMDTVQVTAEAAGRPAGPAGPPASPAGPWCACAESFATPAELAAHLEGRPPQHHASEIAARGAPVLPGGLVRASVGTTDGRLVTAFLAAGKVRRERCGCWAVHAQRPGPGQGPLTSRQVTLFLRFPACGLEHDGQEGQGPRLEPPAVVCREPLPAAAAPVLGQLTSLDPRHRGLSIADLAMAARTGETAAEEAVSALAGRGLIRGHKYAPGGPVQFLPDAEGLYGALREPAGQLEAGR